KSAPIQQLLNRGNYYSDSRDRMLVADSLAAKLRQNKSLDNLGAINKRQFSLRAPVPWRSRIGGVDLQNGLQLSRQQMGFDSALYVRELNNPQTYPATVRMDDGTAAIEGKVILDEKPLANVLVQLKRHPATAQPDTLPDRFVYARTDAGGRFSFTGLTPDR